jgi:hypothetical protein
MSENFHTPWSDSVTQYTQADMNVPLSELDEALSYLKNIMVWCEGDLSYSKGVSGELSWDGLIKLAYLDVNGNTIINKITAGSASLIDNEFIYCDLSASNDATITAEVAALGAGAAECNFEDKNRVVLAFKSSNDELYFVNLRPTVLGVFNQPYDVAGTFSGKPDASLTILRYPFPRTVDFAAAVAGSQGIVGTAPVDDNQSFLLKKNDAEFASMVFSSGETVATFTGDTSTQFTAGDILTMEAPDPKDSALEDVGFSIIGIRST